MARRLRAECFGDFASQQCAPIVAECFLCAKSVQVFRRRRDA